MRLCFFLFLLPLFLAAQQPDFYIWQRKSSPELKSAVIDLQKFSESRLYMLAGELENDGSTTAVPPPFPELLMSRATPVIRIHINHLQTPPEKLAAAVLELYAPWQKCKTLQIDLDAPESKIDYYTKLMRSLRKILPGTQLSATVLPCHLRHKTEFIKLAQSCDFYVLQIHGLEKRNGEYSLMERSTVLTAVADAINLKKSFKLALPFYCHHISGTTIKPDMQFVGSIARFAALQKIGVIIFRLGIKGDTDTLSGNTARNLCKTGKYVPAVCHSWQYTEEGVWYLYIHNDGNFAEKVSLDLAWRSGFTISDADTFNGAELSFDRKKFTLTLPPDQEEKLVLWLRTPAKFDSSTSPLTITRKDTAAK